MSKKLIKSGMIVSAMTLTSRVLGLVRDIVIAKTFGASPLADAFFFANRIPNFFRRLFAEGAFAQAFVPVLSEYQTKDQQQGTNETRQLIAQVSGTLGVIVTLVTLVGMIASPLFVMLFGFGWFVDWLNDGPKASQFDLASSLLKITFPYLWFISFTALSGAILNTLGKFAVSSFSPVLLNVSIIACAIYLSPLLDNPAYGLAWGVFLGGLSQFLLQIPFLYAAGALVKPKWAWQAEGVRKIRKLIIPALFGVSVTQINLLLDSVIATLLVSGAISWLYFADRLLEFPLGLFGIGIATVILPSLSALHAQQDKQQFSETIAWGLKIVCLFGLPAMLGLMVLAQPIIMILFMGGEFTQDTVLKVSYALFAYMSGLISFMFIKILAPAYYARQDTKTPVKIGIKSMLANMIFNICLAPFFGYVGLAMATALSATMNAFLLYRGLKSAGIFYLTTAVKLFFLKVMVAAVVMASVVYWYSPDFQVWLLMSFSEQLKQLFIAIGCGVVSYFLALLVLGIGMGDFKIKTAR